MWEPDRDTLVVFAEPEHAWQADGVDATSRLFIYWTDGSDGAPEGEIAGIEVLGLSTFDRWDALPSNDDRWAVDGSPPLPLDEFLRKIQAERRHQVHHPIAPHAS